MEYHILTGSLERAMRLCFEDALDDTKFTNLILKHAIVHNRMGELQKAACDVADGNYLWCMRSYLHNLSVQKDGIHKTVLRK